MREYLNDDNVKSSDRKNISLFAYDEFLTNKNDRSIVVKLDNTSFRTQSNRLKTEPQDGNIDSPKLKKKMPTNFKTKDNARDDLVSH